jgi:hypothetical protein
MGLQLAAAISALAMSACAGGWLASASRENTPSASTGAAVPASGPRDPGC